MRSCAVSVVAANTDEAGFEGGLRDELVVVIGCRARCLHGCHRPQRIVEPCAVAIRRHRRMVVHPWAGRRAFVAGAMVLCAAAGHRQDDTGRLRIGCSMKAVNQDTGQDLVCASPLSTVCCSVASTAFIVMCAVQSSTTFVRERSATSHRGQQAVRRSPWTADC